MKIFYAMLIAILFSLSLNAQTKLDSMLVNVNQSSVTSGIIYERVTQFANLYNFNKTNYPNTANYKYLRQALHELHKASNQTRLISIQELDNRIAPTTQDNKVDVAILNSTFQILNYNFENPNAGGLLLNETTQKFSQIANKPPFYSMQTTLVAPTKHILLGTNAIFKFNTNVYFQNAVNNIKSLIIDFGPTSKTIISNGVFQSQTVTIPYTSSGTKEFTSQIIFNNNETLTTKGNFYFHYKTLTPPNNNTANGLCTASDPRAKDEFVIAEESFQGYETDDPRIYPKIDYRIFYADASFHTDLKVYKPVIIIDGFDPGDKRKIQDCDCEEDPDCAASSLSNGTFDPDKHRAMTDLMEYENEFGTSSFILPQLRAQGYDVIMVNHPTYTTTNINNGQEVTIDGGAYYIESNALALVALIKKIKQKMAQVGSTEEIAIVGPSMGGQISRYALAYMEKKYADTNDEDWNHNTGLWVSVDSPHLGANIPVGDQALIYLASTVGNSDSASDFYNNQLGSIAAKQQLIELHRDVPNHHLINEDNLNGKVASQGYPSDDGSSYYRTYYNNQENNGLANSHGYPENLRKIALVNGSMTGETIGSNSEKVLNIRGFQRVHIDLPWPLGSITFPVHVASLESYFMPSYGSGFQKVARFKAGFDDRTHKSPNINSRGNMDIVPGGWFPAQNDIAESILGTAPIGGVRGSFWQYTEDNIIYWLSSSTGSSYFELRDFKFNHSFISSFSAVAHKNPNQNWFTPLDYNLVCAGETYFDSYFGHDQNTQHTSFNNESANWLFEELAGNEQDPYFPIDPDSLIGENTACTSELSLYTFDNCKTPGDVTNWEVSSNINIINSTGISITITPSADHRTEGWIKANFSNGTSVTKEIWLGKPQTPTQISGPTNVATGSIVNYLVSSTNGATSFQWSVPYVSNSVNSFDFSSYNWQMKPPYGHSLEAFTGHGEHNGNIIAKGQNRCGIGNPKSLFVKHSKKGKGILPPRFERIVKYDLEDIILYPNPTEEKVRVQLLTNTIKSDKILSISLRNQTMTEIRFYNFGNNINGVEIDIKALSTGVYFLIIRTKNQVLTKKLIKK